MLFYLLIVVAIAFGVYKLLTEVLKMKGFLVWLIVILVAFFNIFINVGISMWAKETGTWTYEETTTKVAAATIQQVQIHILSGLMLLVKLTRQLSMTLPSLTVMNGKW